MTEARRAILIGAIKFVPQVDGIGVAVFKADNALLVPKMDGEFRVTDFLDFYNEQDFKIEYDLPKDYKGRQVNIGDPAPVPFWQKGVCNIIEGDAEKAFVEKIFGKDARTDPVLRDLGRMLDDARSGRISARIAEWEAADIASGYDDVFLGPPSRSRYWITRYRVALQHARKLTTPPHPIDVRLRNAANGWLRKFATRSDPSMLGSVLGNSAQGIFSSAQIRNILFAYIAHKLSVGNRQDVDFLLRDETSFTLFPQGLYMDYIKNGWPHVPFKYTKGDLLETMIEVIKKGADRGNYQNAIKLSKLLFGSENAPIPVDDVVMALVSEKVSRFRKLRRGADEETEQFPLSTDVADWSERALREYLLIEQLSCIIHGGDRVAGRMQYGRFGIEWHEIQHLKSWARPYSDDD